MKQPLRALLLAAGLGTRLRPITLNKPKCLVPIGGEPLLSRWLRQLEQAGCESVLINTHYLQGRSRISQTKLNMTVHTIWNLSCMARQEASLRINHFSTMPLACYPC